MMKPDVTHRLTVGPISVAAAHRLPEHYSAKCAKLHGHNYEITVKLMVMHETYQRLKTPGMILNAEHIKNAVKVYDHDTLGVKNGLSVSTAEAFAHKLACDIADLLKDNLEPGPRVRASSIWVSVAETSHVIASCEMGVYA